jgi:glycosyltransferase involved in cell wall biosynthesis
VVIGVLTSSYPRFEGDPAGSFVADDVRSLLRQGHRIEVIAAGDGATGATRTHDGSLRVTRISTGASSAGSLFYGEGAPEALERGGLRTWIEALHFTSALAVAARMAAPRWDAVVSHWLVPCGLVAILVAPSLPHRGHAHSGDVALLERLRFGRALARLIARSGVKPVFVSRDLKRRFAVLAGRAVGDVIRMLPDAEIFRAVTAEDRSRARQRLGLRRPTVMATGRLVPVKGFDLLLDAVGPLAEVVILGAGPERDALRDRARRKKVSLRLPGMIPRSQVPLWLAAADLYVQPSRVLSSGRTEGMPLATLEALAMGLPVLAARSGGLAELDPGSGRVSFFEPGDAASLRSALSSALRQPETPS